MIAPTQIKEDNRQELASLQQAFELFIRETDALQNSYNDLQQRVASINVELEDTNRELNAKVDELNKSHNFRDSLLSSIPNGVIAVNGDGIIDSFNHAAAGILCALPEDFYGKHYSCFRDCAWTRFADFIDKAFRYGKSYTSKCAFVMSLDRARIPVELTVSLIRDKSGQRIGAVLSFRDLRRIKALEDEVRKAETLAAIGEMAACMAHEIRNPLGGIEGFSTLLARDLKENESTSDQYRIAVNILEGVQSLKRFVSSLLVYARPTVAKPAPVSMNDVIDRVSGLACCEQEEKGEPCDWLNCNVGSGLENTVIDSDLIGQALLNLILNARDAIGAVQRRGQVSVRVERKTNGNAFLKDPNSSTGNQRLDALTGRNADYFFTGRDDAYMRIIVSDNGEGMTDEMRAKLFQPFNTSKADGTGLGLAMVYKIVESHSGVIHVETWAGKGTKFIIDIPLPEGDVQFA